MKRHVLRIARRVGIAVSGGAVIIAGVILAMPLIPGPGIALILLGLGILSVEFEWPRVLLARIKDEGLKLKDLLLRWLARFKEKVLKLKDLILRRKSRTSDDKQ